MKIEVSKDELVALFHSLNSGDISQCATLTKQGWMTFTGNGWNEEWAWNTTKLKKLDEEELYAFYLHQKKSGEEFNKKYTK